MVSVAPSLGLLRPADILSVQRLVGNQAILQRMRDRRTTTETQEEYDKLVATFNKLKDKGKEYYEGLVAALGDKVAADRDTKAAYDTRYDTKVEEKAGIPINVSGFAGTATSYAQVDTTTKGAKEVAYSNYVNLKEGKLIAGYNYGDKDVSDDHGPKGRLNNSEIFWNQMRIVEERTSAKFTPLNEIIRSSIENEETMAMLDLAVTTRERGAEKTWLPGTAEFYAILATDNCKGVPFLLKDHRRALGYKTITSIAHKGQSYIRLHL